MKISVIGTGAYGLAIALSLAKNGHEIMMWTDNVNKELEFKETGKLSSIFFTNSHGLTPRASESLKTVVSCGSFMPRSIWFKSDVEISYSAPKR